MKRIAIDFAPRSLWRTLFCMPPSVRALAGAALVLCAAAAVLGLRHHQQLAAFEAQRALARVAAAPAVLPVALRPVPVAPAQAVAVNAAIMQLNLPWRALHDAVQAATPPAVALLALEPDARKRTLRITAETRASDDMVDYVRALQGQECFSNVTLARHEINDQDPNHPVRFQVDAQWRVP